MTHDGDASPETRQLLRARARALARVPPSDRARDEQLELLEFNVARERYAVEIRHVREVQPLRNLTPLPCTPRFVSGIVSVRGRIVSVIDIRSFFELPEQGITDLHRIVLIESDDLEFGLLADVVTGVVNVPAESLQPAMPTLVGVRSEYLKGVTADRLVVLDIARILADPKIIVHEDVDE